MSDETLNDLIAFLVSQGHSEERALQIAGNHPDAVREMISKTKEKTSDGLSQTQEKDKENEPTAQT